MRFNQVSHSGAKHTLWNIVVNDGYLYITGMYKSTADNLEYRIEKRSAADGSLDTSFGTNGVYTRDISNLLDSLYGLSYSTATGYLYASGRYLDPATVSDWVVNILRLSPVTGAPE